MFCWLSIWRWVVQDHHRQIILLNLIYRFNWRIVTHLLLVSLRSRRLLLQDYSRLLRTSILSCTFLLVNELNNRHDVTRWNICRCFLNTFDWTVATLLSLLSIYDTTLISCKKHRRDFKNLFFHWSIPCFNIDGRTVDPFHTVFIITKVNHLINFSWSTRRSRLLI